jgi:hypothetical protein
MPCLQAAVNRARGLSSLPARIRFNRATWPRDENALIKAEVAEFLKLHRLCLKKYEDDAVQAREHCVSPRRHSRRDADPPNLHGRQNPSMNLDAGEIDQLDATLRNRNRLQETRKWLRHDHPEIRQRMVPHTPVIRMASACRLTYTANSGLSLIPTRPFPAETQPVINRTIL